MRNAMNAEKPIVRSAEKHRRRSALGVAVSFWNGWPELRGPSGR